MSLVIKSQISLLLSTPTTITYNKVFEHSTRLHATMVLSNSNKEKIKRAVPKVNNKLIESTACKLYIAYPDPTQWNDTGLMGAIVLADDLVGRTFFLKLVDIVGSRGVIWDQELYVDFAYHQDRTFFHTFEIEECMVGLLFEDTLEASRFFNKVTNRQKYASKETAGNKNAMKLKNRIAPQGNKVGSRGEFIDSNTGQRSRRAKGVLYYDDQSPPEWRLLYAELAAAGISEEMIAENRQFIKDYIAKQGGPLVGLEPPIPRRYAQGHTQSVTPVSQQLSEDSRKIKKAPPPPPPSSSQSQAHKAQQVSSYSPSPVLYTPSSVPPTPVPHAASNYNTEDFSGIESRLDLQSPSTATTPASPQTARFRVLPPNARIPQVQNQNVLHSIASSNSGMTEHNSLHKPAQYFQSPAQSPIASNSAHGAPPPLPSQNKRSGPPPPPRAGVRPSISVYPRYDSKSAPVTPGEGMPPPPPPRASRVITPLSPVRNATATHVTPTPNPPLSQGQMRPPPPPFSARSTAASILPQPVMPHSQEQPLEMAAPPEQKLQTILSDPHYKAPLPPKRVSVPQPASQQSTAPCTSPVPTYDTQTNHISPSVPTTSPVPFSAAQLQTLSEPNTGVPQPPPLSLTQQYPQGGDPPDRLTLSPEHPTIPQKIGAPPPPPLPPAQQSSPQSGAPPPPPLSALADSTAVTPSATHTGDASRDALLASIRDSGIRMLKKTDAPQLEKSSVLLQEAKGEPIPSTSLHPAPNQPETLADALASALNKRKGKVAASDDEDDGDDW